MSNLLYYGDNLDVLRRYVADESVDLIYLDPPFNSAQNYNVLFAEQDGTRSASQIRAFEDTWRWDEAAALAYQEIVETGGKVSQAMQGFRAFLGDTDMLAYLSMMAPRLVELRRVLKSTGSIYLHCDPTASHYLKILMDSVFGSRCFRNDITWQRTSGRKAGNQFGKVHDVLLFYSRSDVATWHPPAVPHTAETIRGHDLGKDDSGAIFRISDLSGSGHGPVRIFGERGPIPPPKGRHWMFDQDGIDRLLGENRIIYTKGGTPRLKTYIDDLPGVAVHDVWTDIEPINSAAAERLGYPTQKPEALLERILKASSNEGDTVLDPFCGCGTTIAAAQQLNRKWIGIDITHLAITLIRHRLSDSFGDKVKYQIVGEPTSLEDARALAESGDRFQFQWWALGLVGARPTEQKKGADQGIDGRLYFHDEGAKGKTKQIILSVKSGGVSVKDVRDLRGVIDREKAAVGVLISLENPTRPMRTEAASCGFYASPWGTKHPVLQILTIEELLTGKSIDYPASANVTHRRAPRQITPDGTQEEML